jgi:hypothetical protein
MNHLFPQVLSELLWLAMFLLGIFGVKFLHDQLSILKDMNLHIHMVIDKINKHEEILNNHEVRIKGLESDDETRRQD